MSTALIISVGGSPEPVIKSIQHHRPGFVCFFASQQSVDKLGEIKEKLTESGVAFNDWKIIVDDADNIEQCFEKAMECPKIIEEKAADIEEVIVDYTGATKAMTAALAMMSIAKGYHQLSYVGGIERNKEGLGIVVTGTERIIEKQSPWLLLAVEEKRKLCQYFNSYNYEAALETASYSLKHLTHSRERALMETICLICEGYMHWDRFEHREAEKKLQKGKTMLQQYLALIPNGRLQAFLEKVENNCSSLANLHKEEGREEGGEHHLRDLLCNASRRAAQGKYDDAVARLYRALEMLGQIRFQEYFQCPTGNVVLEKLSENLQDEYRTKYTADDGKIKLGLYATFEALAEAGETTGLSFRNNYERLRGLLSARNSSILAHGINPLTQDAYNSFRDSMKDLFNLKAEALFPELDL